MKENASIGKQFILAFTLFLIVPLAVVFIFFLVTIYNAGEEKVSQELQVVSHAVASKINTRLGSPAAYLSSIADFVANDHDKSELRELLSAGIKNHSIFDAVYVLNNEKRITCMAFSGLSRHSREDFVGIRLSNVKGSADGQEYWSRPFISLATNKYVVRFSVKYPDGYIVGDLNLDFITNTLLHARVLENTNVFIVDAKGDVISTSKRLDHVIHENFFRHPAVMEIYRGGHIAFHYDRHGQKYSGSGFKIPLPDWYLVVEQKDKVGFALFYDLLYVTIIACVLVVLFVLTSLFFIKRKIIGPFRLLTKRSELLSEGEYVEFSEKDKNTFRELSKLYESFENMSKKIMEREGALREKEEYVRSIFDSTTNTGILVISGAGESVITDANMGAELITGYKTAELLGLPPEGLVKSIGNDITKMRKESAKKKGTVTSRFEMTKKNGVSFPVMCTVYPLWHAGSEVETFIVVFSDITEITSIQNALESEKERLDVTLKSMGEGVLATDRQGRITLVNSSAENLIGQKYRFMMGREIGDIIQMYDYSTGEDLSGQLSSLENTSRKTFRANIVSSHAGIITVTIISSAMLNSKGDVIGFVYVFRDITERIRMEQELINRKQQLEEINRNLELRVEEEAEKRRRNEQLLFEQAKFAAMGQMISAIAHQWRQPLNALALYTQDIEDAYSAGEVDGEYLESYVQNSMSLINHMSYTIDDFRNFFHSSNVKEKVNLVDVVAQSLSLVSTQLRNQNVDFEISVRAGDKSDVFVNNMPPAGYVYGQDVDIFPSELKQVVLNIIQNARDAITEKREKSTKTSGNIFISIEYLNEKVILSISNNGGRIPEDSLVRIFDPYYTTKPEGEGTGIGLYMSKIMVEDHMGGFLIAENIDNGAKFTITLYNDT